MTAAQDGKRHLLRCRLILALTLLLDIFVLPCHSSSAQHDPVHHLNRKTIDDMECLWFEQPLNHFQPNSPTYRQRYCVYDKYKTSALSPILFYVGNESPIEQYINHTGLMWELAPELQATVVFAEHRYEGQSIPTIDKECMSYCSSKQALADYALLLREILNPTSRRPVIAFGGSYGGMLASWMRMAASAPIWGFPRQLYGGIDRAYQAISRVFDYQYPPTSITAETGGTAKETNKDDDKGSSPCRQNLLAAWPLIHYLGESEEGRTLLQKSFSLCPSSKIQTPDDAAALLDWAKAPWFAMAEGSFPYPSSYITYSLGKPSCWCTKSWSRSQQDRC